MKNKKSNKGYSILDTKINVWNSSEFSKIINKYIIKETLSTLGLKGINNIYLLNLCNDKSTSQLELSLFKKAFMISSSKYIVKMDTLMQTLVTTKKYNKLKLYNYAYLLKFLTMHFLIEITNSSIIDTHLKENKKMQHNSAYIAFYEGSTYVK